MPEHLIRLRGGWERLGTAGESLTTRVTLPLVTRPDGPGRLRISRRFQAPRLDPYREALWLRLDAVAGLISAALNGREIALPTGRPTLLVPLVLDPASRNELILEAELPPTGSASTAGFPWGEVALVIRQADPSG